MGSAGGVRWVAGLGRAVTGGMAGLGGDDGCRRCVAGLGAAARWRRTVLLGIYVTRLVDNRGNESAHHRRTYEEVHG